jgi:glycosyltransferase involved in cell wall biosynthesis
VVDWHEVWTRDYWREYLGRLGGDIGWAVQRLCAVVPQTAFCFSDLHAQRLRDEGVHDVTKLPGEYEGPMDIVAGEHVESLVLFAGRHIPEKRVPAIAPAVLRAREHNPSLSALILGDGPERQKVVTQVRVLGLEGIVEVPGFVASEVVDDAMLRALCLLLPSRREGYGLVVLEAAARGTPSIVVAAPDNAAVELITEGENGFIAHTDSPADLAAAIAAVEAGGPGLRESTRRWFAANAPRMSLKRSLEVVLEVYSAAPTPPR